MAHMSSGEKAKLLLKKAKKGKFKRKDEARAKLEAMTKEELAEWNLQQHIGQIENRLTVYEWDYEHDQLPSVKQSIFKELLKEYLELAPEPKEKWKKYGVQ